MSLNRLQEKSRTDISRQWGFFSSPHFWEKTDAIIEPFDTGFSCPSCSNILETNYCQSCGCFISPSWELLARWSDVIEVLLDDEKESTKKVIFKSDLFEILKASTSQGKSVSIDIKYRGNIYRLIFTAWESRTKKVFTMVWKNFKYKYLPDDEYWKIQNIVKNISYSPEKYGLSKLKAFKK